MTQADLNRIVERVCGLSFGGDVSYSSILGADGVSYINWNQDAEEDQKIDILTCLEYCRMAFPQFEWVIRRDIPTSYRVAYIGITCIGEAANNELLD